jgi:hypothetical protein
MHPSSRPPLLRPGLSAALVLLLALVVPASAAAHGIGPASDLSILGFIPLGIEHMLLGWDHLLFIAGALLVAREARAAAKIITVFVLGHSATLILATLVGWRVNPTLVDVVIGLSVAFVAVAVIRGARPDRNFTLAILGFGLIHGLGLSTRLQDLGLPDNGVFFKVVAFNIGLEIGQLIAIVAMVAITALVLRFWTDRTPQIDAALRRLLAIGLVAGSVLAVSTVLYRGAVGEEAEAAPAAAASPAAQAAGCTEGPRTIEFPGGGGHAEKQFFEPGESAPMADMGHSLADGHVAFLYRPDLAEAELEKLRAVVTDVPGGVTLAAPVTDQESAVMAVTAETTLTCGSVDEAALTDFTTTWLTALRG